MLVTIVCYCSPFLCLPPLRDHRKTIETQQRDHRATIERDHSERLSLIDSFGLKCGDASTSNCFKEGSRGANYSMTETGIAGSSKNRNSLSALVLSLASALSFSSGNGNSLLAFALSWASALSFSSGNGNSWE